MNGSHAGARLTEAQCEQRCRGPLGELHQYSWPGKRRFIIPLMKQCHEFDAHIKCFYTLPQRYFILKTFFHGCG